MLKNIENTHKKQKVLAYSTEMSYLCMRKWYYSLKWLKKE